MSMPLCGLRGLAVEESSQAERCSSVRRRTGARHLQVGGANPPSRCRARARRGPSHGRSARDPRRSGSTLRWSFTCQALLGILLGRDRELERRLICACLPAPARCAGMSTPTAGLACVERDADDRRPGCAVRQRPARDDRCTYTAPGSVGAAPRSSMRDSARHAPLLGRSTEGGARRARRESGDDRNRPAAQPHRARASFGSRRLPGGRRMDDEHAGASSGRGRAVLRSRRPAELQSHPEHVAIRGRDDGIAAIERRERTHGVQRAQRDVEAVPRGRPRRPRPAGRERTRGSIRAACAAPATRIAGEARESSARGRRQSFAGAVEPRAASASGRSRPSSSSSRCACWRRRAPG